MSRTRTLLALAIAFLTCLSWVVPTDLIAQAKPPSSDIRILPIRA